MRIRAEDAARFEAREIYFSLTLISLLFRTDPVVYGKFLAQSRRSRATSPLLFVIDSILLRFHEILVSRIWAWSLLAAFVSHLIYDLHTACCQREVAAFPSSVLPVSAQREQRAAGRGFSESVIESIWRSRGGHPRIATSCTKEKTQTLSRTH